MIPKVVVIFFSFKISFYLTLSLQKEVFYVISPSNSTNCNETNCVTLSQLAESIFTNAHFQNVDLIFTPGDHYLDSEFHVSGIESFSMVSTSFIHSLTNISCLQNHGFHFYNISQISLRGLSFVGCSNIIASTFSLEIENTKFLGNNSSGTALELIEVNASIRHCSFTLNTNGNFRGPIQILNHQKNKCKCLHVNCYAHVGGALIANRSTIVIESSDFDENTAEIGGALFATTGTNIKLLFNSFTKNNAMYRVTSCGNKFCHFGGAMHCESVSKFHQLNVTVLGTDFYKNKARYGGAISTCNCTLSLEFSIFHGNGAISEGGAIEASVISDVHIYNCKFLGNIAGDSGGAIGLYFISTMTINMSLFNENGVKLYAGALYIEATSVVNISSSIFYNNYSFKSGGAVTVRSHSAVFVHQTEFSENDATVSGGAILVKKANLVLNQSLFRNSSTRNRAGAVDAIENSSLKLYKCHFVSNFAIDMGGGAINAEYTKSIIIDESIFIQNVLSDGIGGAVLASNTALTLNNCWFMGNIVRSAGGAIAATRSQVHFRNTCNFEQNEAYYGGAIYARDSELYVHANLTILLSIAYIFGGGAMLQFSKLVCQEDAIINVYNNSAAIKGGGIYSTNSRITVHFNREANFSKGSAVYFRNNSAKLGGGVYLELASELFIESTGHVSDQTADTLCNFCFTLNHAHLGGAIYVADETNYETCSGSSKWGHYCFMQSLSIYPSISASNTPKSQYSSLRFERNTASDLRGPVLYGGLLDRCIIRSESDFRREVLNKTTQFIKVILVDGLTSFKLSSKVDNFSNPDIDMFISSSPVRVCLCTPDGRPTCGCKALPVIVKKGSDFKVPLVAVDQVNHTLSNVSIFSSIQHPQSGLGESQLIQRTNDGCTNLTFSIYSPHDFETLTLYAEGPCRNATNSSLSLDVKFSTCTCPIGFQSKASDTTNCVCECDSRLPSVISNCDAQTHTLLRESNFWIASASAYFSNDSHGYLFYPYCPFDFCHRPDMNINVNLNIANGSDVQCANKRSGTLCGSCQDGFSLSLGSSHCLDCSKIWHKYFAVVLVGFILSGVVIVATTLILNLTVATGTLNGILFYANIIQSNSNMYFSSSITKVFSVFISLINLNIGLDICFYNSMDMYQKTWLQMLLPVYVISLLIAIIYFSRHSIWFSRLISKKNPVATLATLVLLSYSKLLQIIISVFSLAKLKSYPDGSIDRVWLADATVKYLHGKHIIIFVVGIFILVLFVAYTLLILFWQWLLKYVKYQKLCLFFEPYHAPYIHKYRYWTGLLLLIRIAVYLTIALNGSGDPSITLLVIIVATSSLLFLKGQIGQIYKRRVTDVLETICYFNILILSAIKLFMQEANHESFIPSFISGLVTLLIYSYVIVYHTITELCLKQCKRLKQIRVKATDTDLSDSIIQPAVQEDKLKTTYSIMSGPGPDLRVYKPHD